MTEKQRDFLYNLWYVAAWPEEVTETPLARWICEEPIVLFRTESGQISALEDRCPHRIVPLSRGKVIGEAIQCGYHGLRFGTDGSCVLNPHGDGSVPRAAKIRSYPVIERHGIVWVWMGPAEPADPETIPDVPYMEDGNGYRTTHNMIAADYRHDLLIDNLMDLSHVEFLHVGSFSSGVLGKVDIDVKEVGDRVHMRRFLHDVPIAPIFRHSYDPEGENIDHWQHQIWHPNQFIEFEFGVVKTGRPAEEGFAFKACHIATPGAKFKTNYFASISRDFDLDDATLDEAMQKGQAGPVIDEDSPMLEAQQEWVGERDLSEYKPIMLNVDAGAVRVRRVMTRLLQAENATLEGQPAQRRAS